MQYALEHVREGDTLVVGYVARPRLEVAVWHAWIFERGGGKIVTHKFDGQKEERLPAKEFFRKYLEALPPAHQGDITFTYEKAKNETPRSLRGLRSDVLVPLGQQQQQEQQPQQAIRTPKGPARQALQQPVVMESTTGDKRAVFSRPSDNEDLLGPAHNRQFAFDRLGTDLGFHSVLSVVFTSFPEDQEHAANTFYFQFGLTDAAVFVWGPFYTEWVVDTAADQRARLRPDYASHVLIPEDAPMDLALTGIGTDLFAAEGTLRLWSTGTVGTVVISKGDHVVVIAADMSLVALGPSLIVHQRRLGLHPNEMLDAVACSEALPKIWPEQEADSEYSWADTEPVEPHGYSCFFFLSSPGPDPKKRKRGEEGASSSASTESQRGDADEHDVTQEFQRVVFRVIQLVLYNPEQNLPHPPPTVFGEVYRSGEHVQGRVLQARVFHAVVPVGEAVTYHLHVATNIDHYIVKRLVGAGINENVSVDSFRGEQSPEITIVAARSTRRTLWLLFSSGTLAEVPLHPDYDPDTTWEFLRRHGQDLGSYITMDKIFPMNCRGVLRDDVYIANRVGQVFMFRNTNWPNPTIQEEGEQVWKEEEEEEETGEGQTLFLSGGFVAEDSLSGHWVYNMSDPADVIFAFSTGPLTLQDKALRTVDALLVEQTPEEAETMLLEGMPRFLIETYFPTLAPHDSYWEHG